MDGDQHFERSDDDARVGVADEPVRTDLVSERGDVVRRAGKREPVEHVIRGHGSDHVLQRCHRRPQVGGGERGLDAPREAEVVLLDEDARALALQQLEDLLALVGGEELLDRGEDGLLQRLGKLGGRW